MSPSSPDDVVTSRDGAQEGPISATGASARACTRCLYVDGMALDFLPAVVPRRFLAHLRVEDDGVCSLCHAYARALDEAHLERERAELLALAKTGPVVIALSGGKDSLSTLWLARRVLMLEVRAVLLDNGFIPPEVVDVARAACAVVDAPLEIARLDGADATAFAQMVAGDDAGRELPCSACSRHLESALVRAARATPASALVSGSASALMTGSASALITGTASALITGTNFFASWGARPSAFTSTRTPLSLASQALPVVHLPYAWRLTRADVQRHLDALAALGVRPVAGLAGSTNCRVPGLLQSRAAQRGHAIDVEDKLLEVLVGHLPRDSASASASPSASASASASAPSPSPSPARAR